MTQPKEIKTIADLTPDGDNFNKHTEFGQKLLEDSLRKFGAGRSVLVDRNGNIIAGNSTTETAAAIGMEDVEVVKTDGKKLVVVQRTDLDLDSPEGRELALADNMTALKGIDLDLDKVRETLGDDLAKAWGMEIISPDQFGDTFSLPDGEKSGIVTVSLMMAKEQADVFKKALKDAQSLEEYKYIETFGNSNQSGNAAYLMATQWADARK